MKLKDILKEAVAEISYKKSGLKKPNLADLDKDDEISSYEKKRGDAIEKSMKTEFKSQAPKKEGIRFGNEERPMETMPSLSRGEMVAMNPINNVCKECGSPMMYEDKMCMECGYMQENMDHEVSMAQNSLKAIVSAASELMNKMGEEEKDIPAWIQDHITNAANYIQQASQNYHEYSEPKHKDGVDLEDLMEKKGTDKFGYTQNAQAAGPFRGAQMAMQHPSLNLEKKKKHASK
jgi:DNA-binding protein H-NS